MGHDTPLAAAVAQLLAYAHLRLVAIHAFYQGQCTARRFTNLLAYHCGCQDVVLYH